MAEDAMEYFASQGRKPSFDARGRVRGFRSRPGAPQANPQRGLTGGSNATSAVDWVGKFNNTGSQMRGAAMAELGMAGSPDTSATGAAGPVGSGGIVGQTLDSAFGPGYWNRLMGRGPTAPQAPSLYTPAPFMPRSPSTPFSVPTPLTGPFGTKATDAANVTANRAMYAPGGAQGMWGSRFRPAPKWESTSLADAAAISLRYQPRRA